MQKNFAISITIVSALLATTASPASISAAIEQKDDERKTDGGSPMSLYEATESLDLRDEFDIFDRPTAQSGALDQPKKLSPQAVEVVGYLGVNNAIRRLREAQLSQRARPQPTTIDSVILQFKLSRVLQRASLQMQETFANIDGDLAQTNMLLAYASSRRDRSLLLTNVATFTGSGTFGILDASTRLGGLTPTSDIFGILGSSTSVVLPLLALKSPKYANPRRNQPRLNMLAPLFEEKSQGDGYAPFVWKYMNAPPPDSVSQKSRRELLIESWKAYRGFGKVAGDKKREAIQEILEAPFKTQKLTIDALKTRAELLIDTRALIQSIYRSLSEIDAALSAS